ncbi:MAG: hypothetical protein DCF26_09395 [Burkholderiales bacterium]|nr:MAG: hypothetical protein DCF26_09395 [Burkholderiales bacterium]
MNIDLIIAQLRTYCPTLAGRVAGAAQFAAVPESTALQVPCAFVIPLDDSPDPSASQNSVRQPLQDVFEVVVVLDNRPDERGQASGKSVHDIRAELWAALLGWQPEPRYDGIAYEGGNVLSIDRARLFWRFEFSAYMEIEPSDGFQEGALAALPHFDGVSLKVDVIDPIADPNLSYPGPDGRIEHNVPVPKTGNLP